MKNAVDLPTLTFTDQRAWEEWLDAHHADAPGVLVQFAKKGSGIPSVSYAEAVESALCYGWIDGQSASLDDRYYRQRFTPRRAKSVWSRINRDKADALIAAGRMRPAGMAQVEAARRDGRWDAAYDSARTITVPEDLQRALDGSERARAAFAALDGRNRYAILVRLQTARKPETRAARLTTFVAMLANGEKPYP